MIRVTLLTSGQHFDHAQMTRDPQEHLVSSFSQANVPMIAASRILFKD
jgi:hypothetical protein